MGYFQACSSGLAERTDASRSGYALAIARRMPNRPGLDRCVGRQTRTAMKGKRKLTTTKWQMAEQCKSEAQGVLKARSARASRFLDAALCAEGVLEPLGGLAGRRSSSWAAHY